MVENVLPVNHQGSKGVYMIGQEVVEVRVRPQRMSEFCLVTDESVTLGDWVLVDVEGERECGQVIRGPFARAEVESYCQGFHKVHRKATAEDLEVLRKNQKTEQEAIRLGKERVEQRQMEMKIVAVDCLFDQSKIKFYFTADGRIDFRELVRDLAHVYKTRIEMRQIGVRDGARMTGGIGICGLTLCCSTWLRKFSPITIKMAKEQNLSLNPQKISGCCGRLLCCLGYEVDTYSAAKKKFPKNGTRVVTEKGEGVITQSNLLKGTVMVVVDEMPHEFALEQIHRPGQAPREKRPPGEEKTTREQEPDTSGEEPFPEDYDG
jgi:cell fate regulator YaaT (PSP1 superfamily)